MKKLRFNHTLSLALSIIVLLAVSVFAEEQPQIDFQNNLKDIQEKIDSLSKSNEEILKFIKNMENSFKLYDDKFSLIEKEIIDIKEKFNNINQEIFKLDANNKLALDKLEDFRLKFDMINDDIKIKADDIKSIRESISVLKRNLETNIENTVECKKSLMELSSQKSNREQTIVEDVLKWEYWGVVASGIAVIALILAITK